MKRFTVIVLAMVVGLFGIFSHGNADNTFDPAPGTITSVVNGSIATVSWEGIGDIAYVEQYRYSPNENGEYKPHFVPISNSVTFDISKGDRYQLVDQSGRWMRISREMAVSRHSDVKLVGTTVECGDSGGCALQVK